MPSFELPDLLLDTRELELFDKLKVEYEEFAGPGLLQQAGKQLAKWGSRIVPDAIEERLGDAKEAVTGAVVGAVSEWDYLHEAMRIAGEGFGELNKLVAARTLSSERVVKALQDEDCHVEQFEQICALRSYDIERVVEKGQLLNISVALAEGAATGAPGFVGIPFNIVASLLLYFRAAQNMGLYYGYDVQGDPAELQYAATATMMSLKPSMAGSTADVEGVKTETRLPGLMSRMMFATELTTLNQALKGSYAEMAQQGGLSLLYVQVRALANKAAQTALDKAGQEGVEAGIFRNMLAQIGQRLPKEAGRRAIPVVGALVGGLFDAAFMHKVLHGSNLIYHKRFLIEKEDRVRLLKDGAANTSLKVADDSGASLVATN